MREVIEFATGGIEALAVAIIVIAILHGSIRFLWNMTNQPEDAYERYKNHLGKGLLLGLEFLVAADVVERSTEPTLQNIMILGLLVVIRTFLSWSLVVEIEGSWPWRRTKSVAGRGASVE